MITELMSTLGQSQLRSLAGRHHRVRVSLAEGALSRGQAGDPVADDAGAQCDNRRQSAMREEEQVKVEHGGGYTRAPRGTMGAKSTDSRHIPATHQSTN